MCPPSRWDLSRQHRGTASGMRCCCPAIVTCLSCIASRRALWVLGVARLDFVRKNDIRENWAGFELEALGAVLVLDDEVGSDDVRGHQVGGELNPRKSQSGGGCQRSTIIAVLSQPWRSLEQRMAFGKKRRQHAANHVFLTNKNLAHFRAQALESFPELRRARLILLADGF